MIALRIFQIQTPRTKVHLSVRTFFCQKFLTPNKFSVQHDKIFSFDIVPFKIAAFLGGVKYFEEPTSASPACNIRPNQNEHILQHSSKVFNKIICSNQRQSMYYGQWWVIHIRPKTNHCLVLSVTQ